MRKTKTLLGTLLLATAVLSTACGPAPAAPTADPAKVKLTPDDKPYVGFVLDTLREERWYKDKALFEKAIQDQGGRVKTLAANGLDDVQLKQAELLIHEGVDVLVVVPHDAEKSAAIVEKAHAVGIKVVSYDRLIKNADVDYYVSFDNEKVGVMQAQEIVKRQPTGSYAYIGGAKTDNNAILFRQGAMSVLQPLIDKGDIRLVYDQYTEGWDPATAQKNMASALQQNGNKIDAVVAANDGTAGGVINSLQAAGVSGVPVSGQDAELAGVQRVAKGTQAMTIYKPITAIAKQAADMALQVAQGTAIQTTSQVNNGKIDVPSILLEPTAVTADNIRDTVIKDDYLKEADIYGTK
ncbi:sugar ABC transporter substrate-binding protein [Paenibacillus sp. Z6-24]